MEVRAELIKQGLYDELAQLLRPPRLKYPEILRYSIPTPAEWSDFYLTPFGFNQVIDSIICNSNKIRLVVVEIGGRIGVCNHKAKTFRKPGKTVNNRSFL
jgi:hypothetical protein